MTQKPSTIGGWAGLVALAVGALFAGGDSSRQGSLGLGVSEANVMVSTALITVATTQTPGGVSGDPCEQFDAKIDWQTNLSAKLLGLSAQTSPKTVYSDTGSFTIPPGATCGS